MLYTGREQNPRVDQAPHTHERRTFTRRIDCEETPGARRPEVHAAPDPRDARAATTGRRAYDID